MGRDCGYLAIMAGLAGGAEVISTPESEVPASEIAQRLRAAFERGKTHAIVVIAEGVKENSAKILSYFDTDKQRAGLSCVLPHLGTSYAAPAQRLRSLVGYPVGRQCRQVPEQWRDRRIGRLSEERGHANPARRDRWTQKADRYGTVRAGPHPGKVIAKLPTPPPPPSPSFPSLPPSQRIAVGSAARVRSSGAAASIAAKH